MTAFIGLALLVLLVFILNALPISVWWLRRTRRRRARAKIATLMRQYFARSESWVVVDTETTGLSETDVIISVAVVSAAGAVLYSSLVALPPRKRISARAAKLHGLSRESLKGAKPWSEVRGEIDRVIAGRECIAYNARFEKRLFLQTDAAHGVKGAKHDWSDIMPVYNHFVGEWDEKRRKVKWQKLPASTHRAPEDCQAVIALMRRMGSSAELSTSSSAQQ